MRDRDKTVRGIDAVRDRDKHETSILLERSKLAGGQGEENEGGGGGRHLRTHI